MRKARFEEFGPFYGYVGISFRTAAFGIRAFPWYACLSDDGGIRASTQKGGVAGKTLPRLRLCSQFTGIVFNQSKGHNSAELLILHSLSSSGVRSASCKPVQFPPS